MACYYYSTPQCLIHYCGYILEHKKIDRARIQTLQNVQLKDTAVIMFTYITVNLSPPLGTRILWSRWRLRPCWFYFRRWRDVWKLCSTLYLRSVLRSRTGRWGTCWVKLNQRNEYFNWLFTTTESAFGNSLSVFEDTLKTASEGISVLMLSGEKVTSRLPCSSMFMISTTWKKTECYQFKVLRI